jgi:hypothetical protein
LTSPSPRHCGAAAETGVEAVTAVAVPAEAEIEEALVRECAVHPDAAALALAPFDEQVMPAVLQAAACAAVQCAGIALALATEPLGGAAATEAADAPLVFWSHASATVALHAAAQRANAVHTS